MAAEGGGVQLTAYGGEAEARGVRVRCAARRPRAGALSLSFDVGGGGLRDVVGLGAGSGIAERADELWTRTCFECFVRQAVDGGGKPTDPYYEVNCEPPQPTACWQVYRFDSHRSPMPPQPAAGGAVRGAAAAWEVLKSDGKWGGVAGSRVWRLDVDVELPTDAAAWSTWEVFPTAIVQGCLPGEKRYEAYWAAAHGKKPDFHRLQAPAAVLLTAPGASSL